MTEYKGIIFDLDQTLVDTSMFEKYREQRRWEDIYEELDLLDISHEILELLFNLRLFHWKILVVSSAREEYVERILDKICKTSDQIFFDGFIGNAGKTAHSKSKKYEEILKSYNVKKAYAYAVGDMQIDIDAANILGIGSIGASWSHIISSQVLSRYDDCDLIIETPRELLNHLKPRHLSITRFPRIDYIDDDEKDFLELKKWLKEKEEADTIKIHQDSYNGGTSHKFKEQYQSISNKLIICRAPLDYNSLQYYYAFVCPNCHRLFERDEIAKKVPSLVKLLRKREIVRQSHHPLISLENYISKNYFFNLKSGPAWLLSKRLGWFTQQISNLNFYCYKCSSLPYDPII